jgi:hypothetical protein
MEVGHEKSEKQMKNLMSLGMNCIKTVFYTLLGHQQTLLYGHFN